MRLFPPPSGQARLRKKIWHGKLRLASIYCRHDGPPARSRQVEIGRGPRYSSRCSPRVSGTEAQGLGDVRLFFFGATDENLTDYLMCGMSVGEISIERQRVFAFGDALCGAPGRDLDNAQQHMARALVRTCGQRFGHLRSAEAKAASLIGDKRMRAFDCVCGRRASERVNIAGSAASAHQKAARLRRVDGVMPLLSLARP